MRCHQVVDDYKTEPSAKAQFFNRRELSGPQVFCLIMLGESPEGVRQHEALSTTQNRVVFARERSDRFVEVPVRIGYSSWSFFDRHCCKITARRL